MLGRILLLPLVCQLLAGCVHDDVGVPCDGPTADTGDTVFSQPTLDCESRICINFRSGVAGPRCTIPCGGDGDCPSEPRLGCQTGFVCRVALPTSTSPIACCRFCVCADDAEPADPLATTCEGLPTHCPSQ